MDHRHKSLNVPYESRFPVVRTPECLYSAETLSAVLLKPGDGCGAFIVESCGWGAGDANEERRSLLDS
jgi:hypothetical protein